MSNTIEDNFKFDSRIRQRMLDKGHVKPDELEARLAQLPDLESQAQLIDIDPPNVIKSDDR